MRRGAAPSRRTTALVLVIAIGLGLASGFALGGCGGSSRKTETTPVTVLEREDFIAVVHALANAEPASVREIAATKNVWQLVANGLPRRLTAAGRAAIQTAATVAAKLTLAPVFREQRAAELTGPGSAPAGLFRTFTGLSGRGWQLINSSIEAIEHGTPAAARFAQANVALYIESVYDGHFSVAQIGKQIESGYEKLGGPTAFGWLLTQTEVDRVAATYSEASARLQPHVGVRLGT